MGEVAKSRRTSYFGPEDGQMVEFWNDSGSAADLRSPARRYRRRPLLLFLVGVGGEPIRMNGMGKFLAYLTNGIFHFL